MNHFTAEAWADFARDVTRDAERPPMLRHLDECPECSATLRALRSVVDLARNEADFEPPATAVRCVKALYAVMPPEPKRNWTFQFMRLMPTLQEPLMEGVRGGVPATRHLLYRRGSLLLDVQIEPHPQRLVAMTGQVIDAAQSGATYGGRQVAVRKGPSEVARTVTNQSGEFHLEFDADDDLILVVDVEGEGSLISPLPSAAMQATRRVPLD